MSSKLKWPVSRVFLAMPFIRRCNSMKEIRDAGTKQESFKSDFTTCLSEPMALLRELFGRLQMNDSSFQVVIQLHCHLVHGPLVAASASPFPCPLSHAMLRVKLFATYCTKWYILDI